MPDDRNARHEALTLQRTRLNGIARRLREDTKENDRAIELVNAELRALDERAPAGRRVTVRG